ncbi:MAG: hypothetical protein FWD58_11330 [Firmicutes bacterium]|nr:hypothetical protein [Bacillota bacterium]
MDNGKEKITLPEELQIQMLEFFLRTSIPRSKKKDNPLSNKIEEDKTQ